MNYIYIGEIVNTHGIKGELRIISDFKYKDQVFKENFKVYVGKQKEQLIIKTHRFHKIYDMLTFENINDINDAIIYKGDKLYINRSDIEINGYLDEDIIGCMVYELDKQIGIVDGILKSSAHDILVIKNKNKNNLVPFIDEFVIKIDIKNKKIEIKTIEGLINEN